MLIVTAIAASVLCFLYVRLSLNVIGYRRKYAVSVGDGGHDDLFRAIRAQANLSEYAPIALVLIACLELNGSPLWLSALLAAAFVTGRVLHPLGIRSAESSFRPRILGMQLTLFSMLGMGAANLVILVMRLL